jgi:hypothetical protein
MVDAAVCGTKCIWRVRRCRAPRTDCVDKDKVAATSILLRPVMTYNMQSKVASKDQA